MTLPVIPAIGSTFGRWSVVGLAASMYQKTALRCRCECGAEKTILSQHLRRGLSTSCGCYRKEFMGRAKRTHGQSATKLFRVWVGMIRRCTDPKEKCFHRYGGRGISVCAQWRGGFEVFAAWAYGNGYAAKLTIDRIDNDGNYEPDNCRWVPHRVNCQNR